MCSIRIVESLIPKFDSSMNASFGLLVMSIIKSEVMSNPITDGWKFPYISCKCSHAVVASELIARFFSPFGPNATVSHVSMVGAFVS